MLTFGVHRVIVGVLGPSYRLYQTMPEGDEPLSPGKTGLQWFGNGPISNPVTGLLGKWGRVLPGPKGLYSVLQHFSVRRRQHHEYKTPTTTLSHLPPSVTSGFSPEIYPRPSSPLQRFPPSKISVHAPTGTGVGRVRGRTTSG